MEIPKCQRYQSHRMPAEESCIQASGAFLRERNVLLSIKLKGVGDLKSALTLGVEIQSLELALMVLVLLWSSISSLCSFSSLLE